MKKHTRVSAHGKMEHYKKDNYGKDETLETKGGHTTKYTTYGHTTRLTLHEWTYNKLNKAPMSPKVIFLQKK